MVSWGKNAHLIVAAARHRLYGLAASIVPCGGVVRLKRQPTTARVIFCVDEVSERLKISFIQ